MKRFNLHNIWQKIWGKDIPPAEDLFPDDLYAYYNPVYLKMVRKQRTKRFFVGFIILIVGFNLIGDLITTIKNIPLIACLGKEVCIYRGPKLNYPGYSIKAVSLDNGEILVTDLSGYNYTYHKIIRFLPRKLIKLFNGTIVPDIDSKYSKKIGKYNEESVELYIPKSNKFIKLTEHPKLFNSREGFTFALFNAGNNGLIVNAKSIILYDSEKKTLKTIDKNNFFNTRNKNLNLILTCVAEYPGNKVLLLTNNNRVDTLFDMHNTRGNIKLKENLLLLDLKTFEYEFLPDFAIKPKYYPRIEDYTILENGKIIIPIRNVYCNNDVLFPQCTMKYDHTEIYDPISKKFSVETSDVLEDNIFAVDLPDGNILFINRASSYIFNNKTNKFERLTKSEEKKYQKVVYELQRLFTKLFGTNLYSRNQSKRKMFKVIKLDKDRFLITCSDLYSWDNLRRCKNTIYYNYTKDIVTEGPKFLYSHIYSDIKRMNNYKLMVIGGRNSLFYYEGDPPNQYTQIIQLK